MSFALITPFIGVPALATAGLLILSAIGAGPARRLTGNLYFAPVLGLGITTAILASAAHIVPLGTAGPLIVLVASCLSVAWAIRSPRRAPVVLPDVIVATAAAFGGLLLAVAPALGQRSYGPVNLHFNDSWFYTSVDWFLLEHRLGGSTHSPILNPPLAVVNYIEAYQARIGIDAWQATFAATVGLDPIFVQSAAQATTVAIIPLTTYALLRHFLGAQPLVGLVGAYFSLSPVTVQLFVDPRPANLAAIALAPVGLAFGARAVTSGTRADAVVAGVAASGLVVTYTEHGPTFALGAALTWLAFVVTSRDRRRLMRRTASRLSLAAATAVLLSPLGFTRAAEYARVLAEGSSTGSPAQAGVSFSTLPVLLTGTLHLHELDTVPSLNTLATVGVYDVTFAILGLAMLAAFIASGHRERLLVLPAVAVLAVSAALYSYFQAQGACGDCVYKSVTLTPVFLAVVVMSAAKSLWRLQGGSSVIRYVVAGIIVSYGALLFRGQVELIRGVDRVEAATSSGSYAIPGVIAEQPAGPVLVEGAASSSDFEPFFHGPELLYLAGRSTEHPLRYEATATALLTGFGLPLEPFASDYRYVLTGFPGLETDRALIQSFGDYALQRRATADVFVLQSPGTRDPAYRREAAIPWLRGPIPLRVSGIGGGATLVLRFTGGVVPSTSFAVAGLPVQQTLSSRPGNKIVCVTMSPSDAPVDLTVVPGDFTSPPIVRDEVDGPARVPKAIGLAAWSLRPPGAGCVE